MRKFIHELRRREVFRTAGLYIGICWIGIEVGDVLVDAFELPGWTMRALIIAAVVGFPVMLVLAWVYDVTDQGIEVQDEATETVVIPFGDRKGDFVVIGVLSVALIISVYLNFTRTKTVEIVEQDPVSLIVADFVNETGNPLFSGTLEQALSLGIEGASFVTAYPRDRALRQAKQLELGETLDAETAKLVAVRQDVQMVLAGSIVPRGDGFELSLNAVDASSQQEIADASVRAKSATDVLGAVNELAADIRKALGDQSLDLELLASGETVTAASLQAMKDYVVAQELAKLGKDEEAIALYQAALDEDPNMARAYSGWALSAHKIGRPEEAEEKWQLALGLLDRMTERERYRTFGLYYTVVSRNYDKAIENYQQLVEKFPADGAGNNNLAILYTFTAQYERALAQSEQLLKIYPGRVLYHANHAQYALYAGDIEKAKAEAAYVIDTDPTFFKSYMILALVALHEGDSDTAMAQYGLMSKKGARALSLSTAGIADILMYNGDFEGAKERLRAGIGRDEEVAYTAGAGTKTIALAQAYAMSGDAEEAIDVVRGIENPRGDGQLVPIAELFAANGLHSEADAIADSYRAQFRPTAKAYAHLIDGMNAHFQGESILAIESFRSALEAADLWIVRYYLAQAYLAAGYPAEAMAEFEACIDRRGEAGGMFFDDVPTFRYTASLDDWRQRASDAFTARATD